MPSAIIAQDTLNVGTPVVIEAKAPTTGYVTVFEDDGETGYFYAVDPTDDKNPIKDALHIYNVEGVRDHDKPSTVQIIWTQNGRQALLVINRYPHAAFDFEQKRGYCRSAFPPTDGTWSIEGHEWKDSILEVFK